jgi:hypothetical protein
LNYNILLDRREDTRAIEIQEQNRFIKSVLEALGVQIEWTPDEPLSIEGKQNLRKEFSKFNIRTINDMDGGIKFFVGEDLIAEWYKVKYKLKQDLSKIDHREQLYLEMNVNFWTIFEQEERQAMETT